MEIFESEDAGVGETVLVKSVSEKALPETPSVPFTSCLGILPESELPVRC